MHGCQQLNYTRSTTESIHTELLNVLDTWRSMCTMLATALFVGGVVDVCAVRVLSIWSEVFKRHSEGGRW